MGAIKVTPADRALANLIKEARNWTCERCRTQHPEKSRGLHASHFVGRGNWSVRLDPDNVFVHCYGCHAYLGSRPHEFSEWARETLGHVRYELLMEKKNDIDRGRRARKLQKEIAGHYRRALQSLLAERAKGVAGTVDVLAFD